MGWFPRLELIATETDLPVDILKIAFGLTAVIFISTYFIIQVLCIEFLPTAPFAIH